MFSKNRGEALIIMVAFALAPLAHGSNQEDGYTGYTIKWNNVKDPAKQREILKYPKSFWDFFLLNVKGLSQYYDEIKDNPVKVSFNKAMTEMRQYACSPSQGFRAKRGFLCTNKDIRDIATTMCKDYVKNWKNTECAKRGTHKIFSFRNKDKTKGYDQKVLNDVNGKVKTLVSAFNDWKNEKEFKGDEKILKEEEKEVKNIEHKIEKEEVIQNNKEENKEEKAKAPEEDPNEKIAEQNAKAPEKDPNEKINQQIKELMTIFQKSKVSYQERKEIKEKNCDLQMMDQQKVAFNPMLQKILEKVCGKKPQENKLKGALKVTREKQAKGIEIDEAFWEDVFAKMGEYAGEGWNPDKLPGFIKKYELENRNGVPQGPVQTVQNKVIAKKEQPKEVTYDEGKVKQAKEIIKGLEFKSNMDSSLELSSKESEINNVLKFQDFCKKVKEAIIPKEPLGDEISPEDIIKAIARGMVCKDPAKKRFFEREKENLQKTDEEKKHTEECGDICSENSMPQWLKQYFQVINKYGEEIINKNK